MEPCNLCKKIEVLQDSHIVPNSITKRIKENGQAVTINPTKNPTSSISNFNYTERLLCWDCEQHLCKFERYGTNLTRNKNIIKRKEDHIIMTGVDYKKYYLYLISILWRAAISKHPEFCTVNMKPEFIEMLRSCIKNNTLLYKSHRLDKLVMISLLRVKNSYTDLSEELIRDLVVTIRLDEECNQERYYYLMHDGFVFTYYHSKPSLGHKNELTHRLRRSNINKFPIVEIKNIKVLNNKLFLAQAAAKNNNL